MLTSDVERDHVATAVAIEGLVAWLRRARDPLGLSASALSVLSRLEAAGELRITELALREELSQPGTTNLINRLEEAGLVVRVSDPSDRRAVLVRITEDGLAQIQRHHAARIERIAQRLRQLDTSDQRTLVQAVGALERLVALHDVPADDETESEGSAR